jgi:hypothetical protein
MAQRSHFHNVAQDYFGVSFCESIELSRRTLMAAKAERQIAPGTKQRSSALIAASLQRRWLMKAVLPLVFTGLLGLGAAGAWAQTAPGDPAGNQTIPEKDLSRPDASRHGGGSGVNDHKKNLSDKLDASGGVIKPPPGVDPEIVKPAPVPEPNSTAVIPPPGVPGGPPGPEPK